jgi:rhodanese-related sulfurtransferase
MIAFTHWAVAGDTDALASHVDLERCLMSFRLIVGGVLLAVAAFSLSYVAGQQVQSRADPGSDPPIPALLQSATEVDGVKFVTVEQALAVTADGDEPVFVDLRTTGEFDAAHIAEAVHIAEADLLDSLSALPEGQPWVLYCACPDDGIAKRAAETLARHGIQHAVVLEGGLNAWRTAGGEVAIDPDLDGEVVDQGCGCNENAEAEKLMQLKKSEAEVEDDE